MGAMPRPVHTGSYGVGGGNIGIAAEIHVEHCALGAFAEDGFTLGEEIVDEIFSVDDAVFLQVFDSFEPALFKGRKFVGCWNGVEGGQSGDVALARGGVLSLEVAEYVAHTQTVT